MGDHADAEIEAEVAVSFDTGVTHMRIGSLFSGIGGLELGLEWAGVGRTIWQVESDPFCRSVLERHWPEANRRVIDVREANASCLSPVDVVCGGFPCQDVSSAGKRVGLAGARSGLWFEFRRIVEELEPRAVVVENVASGASQWLPTVSEQLRELGYRVRALGVSARDVGAPHLRRRVFVLGLGDAMRERREGAEHESRKAQRDESPGASSRLMANTHVRRREVLGLEVQGGGHERSPGDEPHRRHGPSPLPDASGVDVRLQRERLPGGDADAPDALPSPWDGPQPGLGRDADGLPAGLVRRWPAARGEDQETWEPPRLTARPTTRTNRRWRLKALGNAVVPQCAYVVGRVLLEWISEERRRRNK